MLSGGPLLRGGPGTARRLSAWDWGRTGGVRGRKGEQRRGRRAARSNDGGRGSERGPRLGRGWPGDFLAAFPRVLELAGGAAPPPPAGGPCPGARPAPRGGFPRSDFSLGVHFGPLRRPPSALGRPRMRRAPRRRRRRRCRSAGGGTAQQRRPGRGARPAGRGPSRAGPGPRGPLPDRPRGRPGRRVLGSMPSRSGAGVPGGSRRRGGWRSGDDAGSGDRMVTEMSSGCVEGGNRAGRTVRGVGVPRWPFSSRVAGRPRLSPVGRPRRGAPANGPRDGEPAGAHHQAPGISPTADGEALPARRTARRPCVTG